MACSQDLHKGDLVAVSVAMEAAGTEGYITRGSCIEFDPHAAQSLYIGRSQIPHIPCATHGNGQSVSVGVLAHTIIKQHKIQKRPADATQFCVVASAPMNLTVVDLGNHHSQVGFTYALP